MKHITGAALLLAALIGCRGSGNEEAEIAPAEHPDDHAASAAEHAMGGSVNEDLHLRLTATRPMTASDSSRAAEVLAVMRRDLVRYRDIRVAQADGFRQFIPSGGAPIQHYTKARWAWRSRNQLDPSRPTSLLYTKQADGTLALVGAMFTAPAQLSEAELDERLPLSVARWHQHINWCIPPLRDARRRWSETRDGQPVFGPKSPIATAEACEAVGGRFRARLFGWMLHVMAFSGDDPWHMHHEQGGHVH
jgi:hypothetical protein